MPEILKIVLAEDDLILKKVVSRLIVTYFADRGQKTSVLHATDGVFALEVLKQNSPVDLLITDFNMPRMNGADLSREAKKRFPTLPIILWTGKNLEDLPPNCADIVASKLQIREITNIIRTLVQGLEFLPGK